ncbi:MAG: hypothetical protein PHW34_13445 [Hespellia sp.]|nr:hypothetical protein [Hespellia sp.]
MNLQRINQHRTCCRLLYFLNSSVIKFCRETDILSCAEKVCALKLETQIKSLSAELQEKMIQDKHLAEYLLPIMQKEVAPDKVNSLWSQVQEEITSFEPEQLIETMMDDSISKEYLSIFLRYYSNMTLTEDEKEMLQTGLYYYYLRTPKADDILFAKYGKIFCSKIVGSRLLDKVEDYEESLMCIAQNPDLQHILDILLESGYEQGNLDDELFLQMKEQAAVLKPLFVWSIEFYKDRSCMFFTQLLNNHSLLFDLKRLKDKVENGKTQEAYQMVQSRSQYVSFFYNEYFCESWRSAEHEKLIIYAVTHRKKAFLTLIRSHSALFQSMSMRSLLFDSKFYQNAVNINTLNSNNLLQCRKLTSYEEDVLEILASSGPYTFNEIEVLCQMPIDYTNLYTALHHERIDYRMKVIKELINRKALSAGGEVAGLADKLSLKPLSEWMHNEFAHIKRIDAETSILLLKNYDTIKQLIAEAGTLAEARYIAENANELNQVPNMQTMRQNMLDLNKEWLALKESFQIDETFIQNNESRIKEFIFQNGVHIMLTYLKNVPGKKEELRRLVMAELMGRFRELKYYGDDLAKELGYPIQDSLKSRWMENLIEEDGAFTVWEEDALLPVMEIGEVPHHTCLSYIDGQYNQCLLACHDSNKKVLYLKWNGKIVLRAAIRLTKGVFGTERNGEKDHNIPRLEFADFYSAETNELPQETRKKEMLVLFLENAYDAGLPEKLKGTAINLLFRLMKKKARTLNACFVASEYYRTWKPINMISSTFSMYISKSKAGEQYLDSLSGNNRLDQEGSYKANTFLVHNNNLEI